MAALNVTDVSLAAFRSIDAAANGGPDRFFAAFIAARSGLRATMVRGTIRAGRIASGLHCFPAGRWRDVHGLPTLVVLTTDRSG